MVRVSSTRGRGAPLHADDLPERLRRDPPSDEAALAELIDADGRARSRLGDPTGLERYLDAVPGLEGMPVALDAAIEAALRGMCASGRSEEEAVASLVESYPHLRDAIAEAAALNRGLWSTRWLIDRLDDLPPRDLPWDVGPVLEGGRRRYRLTEVLGRGSCGEVYLGEDRRLSDSGHPALVAVKILDGRQASVDARRRFLGEAMRARRVQHPTVVRVLDRGESDGALFIVYEHVRGRTLARYLTEHGGRIDAREAARLVSKIARGVHAAHAAGLIHCDLHPTNVLIDEEGEPRICDFGIAVLADELPGQGLGAWGGRALGSLAFIPPEQHRLEEGAFGAAADVYALGGLLHFLITGDLPNGTSAAQIRARLDADEGAASRLDDRADALDADLGAIRRRALATDPGDRHPSSLELGEDLEAWLSHRPIEWTRPSAVRRARLQVRRRPVVAALACLAGAGLIVGASALSYSYGVVHTRRQRLLDWYGGLRAELGDLRKESDGASLLLGLWLLDKQRADLSMGDDGRVPELARAAGIDTLAAMVEGAYTNAGPPIRRCSSWSRRW